MAAPIAPTTAKPKTPYSQTPSATSRGPSPKDLGFVMPGACVGLFSWFVHVRSADDIPTQLAFGVSGSPSVALYILYPVAASCIPILGLSL